MTELEGGTEEEEEPVTEQQPQPDNSDRVAQPERGQDSPLMTP